MRRFAFVLALILTLSLAAVVFALEVIDEGTGGAPPDTAQEIQKEAAGQKGFFGRMWDGVKNFFGRLFKGGGEPPSTEEIPEEEIPRVAPEDRPKIPAPSIEVLHKPEAPTNEDTVTFTAIVKVRAQQTDKKKCSGGFLGFGQTCSPTGKKVWIPVQWIPESIELVIDGAVKKKCQPAQQGSYESEPVFNCAFTEKYNAETVHSYYAVTKTELFSAEPKEIKTATKFIFVRKFIEVCTAEYNPVCGVDNKTYGNECEAGRADVAIECKDACPCRKPPQEIKDIEVKAPSSFSLQKGQSAVVVNHENVKIKLNEIGDTGVRTGTIPNPFYVDITVTHPGGCGPNADPRCIGPPASSKDYRIFLGSSAETFGLNITFSGRLFGDPGAVLVARFNITKSKPEACLAVYEPVCGVDNKTYSNKCKAGVAGIAVACEGSCPCKPPPTGAICNDCDTQTKDGLKFELKQRDVSVLNMLVCNSNATEKECRESPSAGIDKPLICESFLSGSCSVKCSSIAGRYYVLVEGFRGLFDSVSIKDPEQGGYAYECPQLETADLVGARQNLLNLQTRIDALAVRVEILLANAPDNETKAKWERYLSTFREISRMIGEHVKFLDGVIANPTPDGVAQANTKTEDLRKKIADMLRKLIS